MTVKLRSEDVARTAPEPPLTPLTPDNEPLLDSMKEVFFAHIGEEESGVFCFAVNGDTLLAHGTPGDIYYRLRLETVSAFALECCDWCAAAGAHFRLWERRQVAVAMYSFGHRAPPHYCSRNSEGARCACSCGTQGSR